MANSSPESRIRRRRWFGAICLLVAIGMLLAEQFLLKGRLTPQGYLAYWLTCFLFTILAVYAALVDLQSIGLRSRVEQRGLFQDAVDDIGKDVKNRKDDGGLT